MLMLLGVGVASLVGYGIFSWKFPRPKTVLADEFFLNVPIIKDDNIIVPEPKTWVHKGKETLRVYKFGCQIKPNTANIAGVKIGMKVPDEYIINEFSILVNPETNEVMYVHLGSQYHCDKDPISNCLCLVELYREQMDREFLEKLLGLISNYDLLDAYRQDHWRNEKFVKSNGPTMKKLDQLVRAA